MWCPSCKEDYHEDEAGTCRECYDEASETEGELKREIEDLKSKVAFLHLSSPVDPSPSAPSADIFLRAVSGAGESDAVPSIPAHRAVLMNRSPVFRAMLESDMEESRSGVIKITDVTYNVLRSFVHYLYTAEVLLDEQMGCDLLILAEKYQVKHLKSFCEKFLVSKLNIDNAVVNFAFAHRHNAEQLVEASLSLVLDSMSVLTQQDEYKELVQKDPRLVVEIFEAYLRRRGGTIVVSKK